MDSLLLPYYDEVMADPEGYARKEDELFQDRLYDLEQKTMSEYMMVSSFYHSKMVNETYYDMNQSTVIKDTLNIIRDLISERNFLVARYYIVSLELLMGIRTRLYSIIANMVVNSFDISLLVDKDKFLNTNYTNDIDTNYTKGK